ncbi:MAG: (Fe-S)-binding protein [Bacillota bacterium]
MLEKYLDKLYNCSRCGLCRHWGWNGVEDVCPVYKHTTQYETEYTRGRVKLAKSLAENTLEPNELMTKHILECTLCGRCEVCCPCDIPIHEAFQAMRSDLAAKGYTMPIYEKSAEMIAKEHNPYGPAETKIEERELNKLAKVLYYPGCTINRRANELKEHIESVFQKLGIEYNLYTEDTCCGFPLYDTGMQGGMKDAAEVTLKNFERYKPDIVVTSCPGCLRAIRDLWRKVGAKHDYLVLDISEFLLPKLKDRGIKKDTIVTWHDPCVLGRHMGDYETPRDVIRAVEGTKLVEMAEHHDKAACCGAGGAVFSGFYKLAQEIGKDRIAQAEDTGAEDLLTSCPTCYLNLSRAARKSDIKVRYVTDLLDEVL